MFSPSMEADKYETGWGGSGGYLGLAERDPYPMNIDVNLDLPLAFKLTHLHRKDMFSYNWQLDVDQTPFFIKYGYLWFFNGIPKNERTNIMKQVWEAVKGQYE